MGMLSVWPRFWTYDVTCHVTSHVTCREHMTSSITWHMTSSMTSHDQFQVDRVVLVDRFMGCSLDDHFYFRVISFLYKLVRFWSSSYRSELIVITRTRDLVAPRARTEHYRNSLVVRSITFWNSLPVTLRFTILQWFSGQLYVLSMFVGFGVFTERRVGRVFHHSFRHFIRFVVVFPFLYDFFSPFQSDFNTSC